MDKETSKSWRFDITSLVPCRYQCEKVSQKPCKNDMACHGCLRLRQHGDEF